MALILALLLPLSTAFVAVHWCWPEARRLGDGFVLKLSLAFGLAIGLCSCFFFIKLVLSPSAGPVYLFTESALFLGLLLAFAAALRMNRARTLPPPVATTPDLPIVWRWLLGVGLAVTVSFGLAGSITWLVLSPHGDWDGWAIWNTHARFLYRGGDYWTDYFAKLEWTHPDYPLMMPAIVARLWTYVGRESQFEHRLLDLLILVATGGLLGGALARVRGRTQGLLAVMILATTPVYLEKGSSQYADVPLGYFVLATAVFLCLHDSKGGCRRLVVLAGLMAGFAAWTKNEGMLFLLSVLAARFIVVARAYGVRAWVKEMFAFGLGLVLPLACLAYFKANLAPPNDLVAGQGLRASVDRLLSPSRYGLIAGAFAWETLLIGPGTVLALGVYYVLVGKALPTKLRTGNITCLLILAFMLAGYAVTFLFTPQDLAWHLTVLDRLFMQVWPLALFTFFLAVATPEEALATQLRPKSNLR